MSDEAGSDEAPSGDALPELFAAAISGDGILGDVAIPPRPADGSRVRARTYANEDEEIPAREVTGELATRRVE